jgi:hypothetical protein
LERDRARATGYLQNPCGVQSPLVGGFRHVATGVGPLAPEGYVHCMVQMSAPWSLAQ